MNLLNRMMSYDKTKLNQECNCDKCTNIEVENQTVEYPKLSETEIEQIISERYSYKDEKTKNFIRKALRKHGDRYDYYESVYSKMKNEIIITCRKHENFKPTAERHIKGSNCSKCVGGVKLDVDEFIRRANLVHDYKYDYSKVKYINSNTEVIIICKEHGEFPQKPNKHLIGHGCRLCSANKGGVKLTTEEFIKRSIEKYGFYYDYSEVDYKNMNTDVYIICPKHGGFWQKPSVHLSKYVKYGCDECSNEQVSFNNKLSTEEFLLRIKLIFRDRYLYDFVKYKGYDSDVILICKKHGKFKRNASKLLRGYGCPSCTCSKSIGEIRIENYLTDNKIEYETQKTFQDLKSSHNAYLRFDFYIPSKNLCIEFDGKQHFEPYDFSGKLTKKETLNEFENLKIRDKLKNDYCNKNNIKLLRIKYNENIKNKLNKYFHID